MNARPSADGGTLPTSLLTRLERACDGFERAWKEGRRPRVEDALGPATGPLLTPLLRELLVLDLAYRRLHGETPSPEDYRDRFPDRAALIREVFEAGPAPTATAGGPSPSGGEIDPPATLGRYRVLRKLGRGGMGTVYLAHDVELDRPVALKVPHPDSLRDPETLARFRIEARSVAAFRHPNFCPIYDVGEVDGVPYLAMAYIDGRALATLIRDDRPMPARRAAKVARSLALALAEAHRRGVVHRDLKPANVMVDSRGTLILMDFGLARVLGDDPGLSRSGVPIGTPHYMSPEQVEGRRGAIGPATDIYSLGVVLYELLTGRRPFEGPLMGVLAQIVSTDPPPPSSRRPGLDPELDAICARAMAKAVGDRFASMDAFAEALRAHLARTADPAPAAPPPAGVGPVNPDVAGAATIRLDPDPPIPAIRPGGPRGRRGPSGKRRLALATSVLIATGLIIAATSAWNSGNGLGPRPGKVAPAPVPVVESPKVSPAATRPDRPPAPAVVAGPGATARAPRVLLVIPHDRFWYPDYAPLRDGLEKGGAKVVVASTALGPPIPHPRSPVPHRPIRPDLLLSEAVAADYDAVVFTGEGIEEFIGDSGGDARRVIAEMGRGGKVLAGVCRGIGVLADAGTLRGQRAALSEYLPPELIDGGRAREWVRERRDGIVVSGRVLTAGHWDGARNLALEILRMLGRG